MFTKRDRVPEVMAKDVAALAKQIHALVDELLALAGGTITSTNSRETHLPVPAGKIRVGTTGGLRRLIQEGYFDTPRQLSEVIEHLQSKGMYYPRENISMGLLNLYKEKLLQRINEKGSKLFKYVIRR